MAARPQPKCSAALSYVVSPRLRPLVVLGPTSLRVRPRVVLRAQLFTTSKPSVLPASSIRLPTLFTRVAQRRHASSGSDKRATRPGDDQGRGLASSGDERKPTRPKLRERLQKTLPHENLYTLPNILTFSRLLSTPAIGYFIVTNQPVAACALFAYAGVTDLLDGWIARRFKQQTVVGTVIDPIADKTLMTVLTVCLAVKGALPIWLATLILGRDASLAVAAIYYRFASLPRPRTLARYWDFSLPSAEVHPTNISKLNTLLQLLLIGMTLAVPLVDAAGISEVPLPVPASGTGGDEGWLAKVGTDRAMGMAQWTVATTTVWSGLSYLYTRDAVKILGNDMDAGKKRAIVRRGRGVIGLCFVGCAGVAVGLERMYASRADAKQEGKTRDTGVR